MLKFLGRSLGRRAAVARRDVLRVGGLSFAGLSLADLFRARAATHWADAGANQSARETASGKSVILIWMRGGPSHIDSFDTKPEAPAEIRGEFQPIATNVPGVRICEHMPLLAGAMDKLAIVRGIKSNDLGDHTPRYILTGSPDRGKRPVFGAVVSHLRPRSDGLPPFVSVGTGTPTRKAFEICATNFRAWIAGSTRSSRTCMIGGWSGTWRWSCGENSAARLESRVATAAIIGPTPGRPSWPGAASKWGKRLAKPMLMAAVRRAAPIRPVTCWRRSTVTWRSTPRRCSPIATSGRSPYWTIPSRSANYLDGAANSITVSSARRTRRWLLSGLVRGLRSRFRSV